MSGGVESAVNSLAEKIGIPAVFTHFVEEQPDLAHLLYACATGDQKEIRTRLTAIGNEQSAKAYAQLTGEEIPRYVAAQIGSSIRFARLCLAFSPPSRVDEKQKHEQTEARSGAVRACRELLSLSAEYVLHHPNRSYPLGKDFALHYRIAQLIPTVFGIRTIDEVQAATLQKEEEIASRVAINGINEMVNIGLPWIHNHPKRLAQETDKSPDFYSHHEGLATHLLSDYSIPQRVMKQFQKPIERFQRMIIIGNAASGLFDAALLVQFAADNFIPCSHAAIYFSPQRMQDRSPEIPKTLEDVLQDPATADTTVMFVDSFASSGESALGSLRTLARLRPTNRPLYAFISTSGSSLIRTLNPAFTCLHALRDNINAQPVENPQSRTDWYGASLFSYTP